MISELFYKLPAVNLSFYDGKEQNKMFNLKKNFLKF